MSLAEKIDVARGWLDEADRDLFAAAAALDEVKARRARVLAALRALGDEIEAQVPPEDVITLPGAAHTLPALVAERERLRQYLAELKAPKAKATKGARPGRPKGAPAVGGRKDEAG